MSQNEITEALEHNARLQDKWNIRLDNEEQHIIKNNLDVTDYLEECDDTLWLLKIEQRDLDAMQG